MPVSASSRDLGAPCFGVDVVLAVLRQAHGEPVHSAVAFLFLIMYMALAHSS